MSTSELWSVSSVPCLALDVEIRWHRRAHQILCLALCFFLFRPFHSVSLLQLDSTLASPTGKLNWATALSRRHAVTVEGLSGAALKKLRLTDAAAEHALRRLLAHGWLRELPASLALLDGGKGDRFICLGERSYTELKRYVENKTEGRQCAVCVKSCVLVGGDMGAQMHAARALVPLGAAFFCVCASFVHSTCLLRFLLLCIFSRVHRA